MGFNTTLISLLLLSVFSQLILFTAGQVSSSNITIAPTLSPGFIGVPASVWVLESTSPRAVVAEFQVQSSSPLPSVRVLSITPHAHLLEAPIVNPTSVSGIFNVQIVLNGSLDFERISLFSVRLGLATASGKYLEQTFHMRVLDINEPPACEPLFQLPGAQVHVPESQPVPVTVYTVLASDPDHNDTLSFSITQVFPSSSRAQFHMSVSGALISSHPFDYHGGPKEFVVSVSVSDRQGENCTGTVRITVLRVYNPPLDFVLPSQNVSIDENQEAGVVVASVRADSSAPDVLYSILRHYTPFTIGRDDGVIRTSYKLDLEADRALARSVVLVRAFSLADERSGTATVTIHVLDVNEYPPFCSPPVFVLEVSETTEVGRNLGSLTCVDIDVTGHRVALTLLDNSVSRFKFRLKDGQLQVNNTLDYDSAEIASNNFQYEATILATDTGTPPRTSQVRVLVTVTPVNEFDPGFLAPLEIGVPEDSRPGWAVGVVQARDTDWPFNNIRYSIVSGDTSFTIDPEGGQLYLGRELDFETQQVHVVSVQAEDYDQDIDRTNRKRRTQDIVIRVENVNDNAPVCEPVSYESTIFSTRSHTLPILTLSCTDLDNDVLTATITNGAAVDRFQMAGLTLSSRNLFSYVVEGVYDRTLFEVTISVSDGRHHTDAVAYIYVVPWTTTIPTTTTTTTTKAAQVVTVNAPFWDPEPWFVAVMTVTGCLLLLVLGLLTWAILRRTLGWETKDTTAPSEMEEIDKLSTHGSQNDAFENDQSPLDGDVSLSKVSLQDELMRFDGKAQDPVSGRSYLFNSTTGERRWL